MEQTPRAHTVSLGCPEDAATSYVMFGGGKDGSIPTLGRRHIPLGMQVRKSFLETIYCI